MDVKTLTTKKGNFNKGEKAFLVAEGAKYGIAEPSNKDCPDCWRDMAIQIAVASAPKCKGTRLRGAAATDGVIFKGRLITNPLDEDTLAWMRENDFPAQLLTTDAED